MIRIATWADAAAIVEIWNPYIHKTTATFTTDEKTADAIGQNIQARLDEGKAFFVAEQGGAILGFATYFQFRSGPGYAHTMEHTVILSPSACGQGVGGMLVKALEDHARDAGVHSLVAAISGENPQAIRFHEQRGFSLVAKIPETGFKFGRWMDLILMQKRL